MRTSPARTADWSSATSTRIIRFLHGFSGFPRVLRLIGRVARTVQTLAWPEFSGPASNVPSSRATRSSIPTRPAPEPGARGPSRSPYGLVTRTVRESSSWADGDGDAAGGGVLEGVGQGLLDDPVGGELDRGGQPGLVGGVEA